MDPFGGIYNIVIHHHSIDIRENQFFPLYQEIHNFMAFIWKMISIRDVHVP